jgi:hypothetical protein
MSSLSFGVTATPWSNEAMRDFFSRNSNILAIITSIAAAASIGYNIIQKTEISRLDMIREIAKQKESLLNDGYNEILMNRVSELRENIAEVSRNQGKIEGMTSVAMNIAPENNQTSAIWHEGYYRGLGQVAYVEEGAYIAGYHRATEDMNCPSSVREKMNADAIRKYQQDKTIDIETEQFNKALDEAEKRRKNIESIKNTSPKNESKDEAQKTEVQPEAPKSTTPDKK